MKRLVRKIVLIILGGNKRLVCHFIRNKFWKYIGFILLTVKYGIKGNHIWRKTETYVSNKGQTPLHRYVCGKTDLLKVNYYPHFPN